MHAPNLHRTSFWSSRLSLFSGSRSNQYQGSFVFKPQAYHDFFSVTDLGHFSFGPSRSTVQLPAASSCQDHPGLVFLTVWNSLDVSQRIVWDRLLELELPWCPGDRSTFWPEVVAVEHKFVGLHDFVKVSTSALLKSFLLIMCIDAPESTTNSLSSGFNVDAGRHLFSGDEKNVALWCSFNLNTFFGWLPRCFAGTLLLPLCLFL